MPCSRACCGAAVPHRGFGRLGSAIDLAFAVTLAIVVGRFFAYWVAKYVLTAMILYGDTRGRPASMSTAIETSDARIIDLLRNRSMSVPEIAAATSVTATAVRQRLNRLMSQGLVGRETARAGRGRPSHRYLLTEKARRQVGNNYGDLALMLWDEIRSVKDPALRRGLFRRVAESLARLYAGRVAGASLAARMETLKDLFAERRVPLAVTGGGAAPVLTVLDCPYPELAEKDRGICAVEKMLFAELLAAPMKLTRCRLEGHTCCQFEAGESSGQ